MRFMAEYPIVSDTDGGAWVEPQNIINFAQTMEKAGLHALALTDHPAPSKKWLDGGGHETFDPFVGLGFVAAATTTLQLMTHLVVVPYRNPLVQARSMAAVDRLSGGRAIFCLGTGYLRSEFRALGVDMDERNALFDEAADVFRTVFTTDSFSYEGRHFTASNIIIKPGPVQLPHPPLWLGGNSPRVLDRIAEWGQGWSALMGSAELAATTRSPGISTIEDLTAVVKDLHARIDARGRDRSEVEINAHGPQTDLTNGASADQRIDELGRLAEGGVTWSGITLPHDSYSKGIDLLNQFGEEVAAKFR